MPPIEPGRDYAVLTGDVIDSTSLEAAPRRRLPELLHEISETLLAWYGEDRLSPVSVFGGDSWRILLATPGDALRAGLFVRASLLASELNVDTRVAIAVGGVDFVPEGDIERADGEAFRLSGRLLGELGSFSMGYASPDAAASRHWDLAMRLIDALVRSNWTAARARAVSGALRGLTGSQIGELWPSPISKQTAGRHLAEASWDAIESALAQFELE